MYFIIKFRILFNIISAIILIWTENRKEISKVLNQSKFYGSSHVKYSGFQNPGNLSLCTDPHLPAFPQENLLRFLLRRRGSALKLENLKELSGIQEFFIVESRVLGFCIRNPAPEMRVSLTIGIRNPSSNDRKSGIQYLQSRIHSLESRIQDCLGLIYIGRHGNKSTYICIN